MRLLHHLPFSVRSFSSPRPSYLIPPATLHPSLPPSICLLLPGALCRRCHNRRWNRFICSNVVWAAAWHGAERHFLPAHWELLALCLHFMCFQTGQSAPLSSARLPFFLSRPPTIALCKKPPTFIPDRQVPFSPLLLPLFAPLSRLCDHSYKITCLSVVFCHLNYFVHLLHISERRYWSHQKPAVINLHPRWSY